jgi:hypothetical protein
MAHRIRRLISRFVIAAVLLVAALYGLTRAYLEYAAHRATTMLAEAVHVQIGDSEGSVLPLVRRYGGLGWTPDPLPPREQWNVRHIGERKAQTCAKAMFRHLCAASSRPVEPRVSISKKLAGKNDACVFEDRDLGAPCPTNRLFGCGTVYEVTP